MTVADLEELSVPDYGLDAQGCLTRQFDDYTAIIQIISLLTGPP
ncbi:MAG: hypothetical protein AB1894_15480 [Chloroflexota bacterium]